MCFTPDGKLVVSASEDGTLRVWDLGTYECLAVYQGRCGISSISTINATGRFVYTAFNGIVCELVLTALHNFHTGAPKVTAVRIWRYEDNGDYSIWEEDITTACSWCGSRFIVERQIIEKIESLSSVKADSHMQETKEFSPQLNLNSKCPCCNKPIRFNPFIVDNKKARINSEFYKGMNSEFTERLNGPTSAP